MLRISDGSYKVKNKLKPKKGSKKKKNKRKKRSQRNKPRQNYGIYKTLSKYT